MSTFDAWCDFCYAAEFNGDIGCTPAFNRHFKHRMSSRVVYESDRFIAIAGLGPITDGYVLLLSREHFHSMAQLASDEYYKELEHVYNHIITILTKLYIRPVVFEHGPMLMQEGRSVVCQGGGSCMDHAHFHFCPVSVSTDAIVKQLKDRHTYIAITSLVELRRQQQKNMPYLFFETDRGQRWLFDAPSIPSQYVRRLIAEAVGVPDRWNWHVYLGQERVQATVEQFKKQKLG